jgi:hypothetical protein
MCVCVCVCVVGWVGEGGSVALWLVGKEDKVTWYLDPYREQQSLTESHPRRNSQYQ